MAVMSASVRAIRPQDQKLGRVASRCTYLLTVFVSVIVVSLVIIVSIICNWDVDAVMKGSIKIDNWLFEKELANNKSEAFKKHRHQFCNAVEEVYLVKKKCKIYRGCKVTSFRKGSVIVDFEIRLHSTLVQQEDDKRILSDTLILVLLKKDLTVTAFKDFHIDEFQIRLPGIEKYASYLVPIAKKDSTDPCASWEDQWNHMEAPKNASCPLGWIRHKTSCYLFFTKYYAYVSHAENYCTALQAHLAIIKSEHQENFIESTVESLGYKKHFFWIGARRDPVRFNWLDYSRGDGVAAVTPMCYRKWQIGQPNNYAGNEKYVVYVNRGWDDVRGYPVKHYFICEKDINAKPVVQ